MALCVPQMHKLDRIPTRNGEFSAHAVSGGDDPTITEAPDDTVDILEIPRFKPLAGTNELSPFDSMIPNDRYSSQGRGQAAGRQMPVIEPDRRAEAVPISLSPADRFLEARVYATERLTPIEPLQADDLIPITSPTPRKWLGMPFSAPMIVLLFGALGTIAGVFFLFTSSNNVLREPISNIPISSRVPVKVPAAIVSPTSSSEQTLHNQQITPPEALSPNFHPDTSHHPAPRTVSRPRIGTKKGVDRAESDPQARTKIKNKVTVDDLINDN